jgi:hypothetical protein
MLGVLVMVGIEVIGGLSPAPLIVSDGSPTGSSIAFGALDTWPFMRVNESDCL